MKQQLLGNRKRGRLFVISAPAGTGKTTLVRRLICEFPELVAGVSFTTRLPRPGEVDGQDYFFVTQEEFKRKIEKKDLLEHAEVFGHFYGTSRSFIDSKLALGKHVLLVIDTQGALQIKAKMESVLIFVQPPSIDELRVRLAKRQTESAESIEKRIAWAVHEMSLVKEYDYAMINDDLDIAYTILRSIVIAEEYRVG